MPFLSEEDFCIAAREWWRGWWLAGSFATRCVSVIFPFFWKPSRRAFKFGIFKGAKPRCKLFSGIRRFSWNLDRASVVEREFLKIVHHFEILKDKLQLMKDTLGKLKIFAFWNLDRASVVEREFLRILHHFDK